VILLFFIGTDHPEGELLGDFFVFNRSKHSKGGFYKCSLQEQLPEYYLKSGFSGDFGRILKFFLFFE